MDPGEVLMLFVATMMMLSLLTWSWTPIVAMLFILWWIDSVMK